MNFRVVIAIFGTTLLLVACGSNPPAPLIERSPVVREKPLGAAAAADEVRAGFYVVKKGDTLYSIALEHGQEYKDIVTWNNLDNPNLIKIGQQLRVEPAEGTPVAETRPVTAPPVVESRPLSSSGSFGSAAATNHISTNTDTYKREPKAGTQLYSDQAWAQAQQVEPSSPVTKPTMPVAPIEPAAPPAETPPLPPAVNNETLDWSWPVVGRIVGPYAEGTNKGIDISAKTGQPVLAAAAGKVTLVSSALRGYGNLVVVKHNTTYLSVYAHNSKILVKEGDSVTKGQQIAEVGSSDAGQPQLHFEIRRQGKPVDPAQFLPKH